MPREIFGGQKTTLHVDGISVYEFDRETGNITQHRIENLLINNEQVQPEEGVIARLQAEHSVTAPLATTAANQIVEFRSYYHPNLLASLLGSTGSSSGGPTSLFAMEANGQEHTSSSSSSSSSSSKSSDGSDWDALDRKNKSRKKFGLKPLSMDEFLELEAQVQQIAQEQQRKHAAAAASSNTADMNDVKEPNFFQKLFGNVLPESCESNFDCERPEVCCDFGFKKMCCSSGTPVGQDGLPQYAYVPVPVSIEDPGNFNKGRYY